MTSITIVKGNPIVARSKGASYNSFNIISFYYKLKNVISINGLKLIFLNIPNLIDFSFFRIIIRNIQFEPNNNIAIYLSREVEGLAL